MVFPYLAFQSGQCIPALELYGQAFGQKHIHVRRYGEHAPVPGMEDYVMHAEMELACGGRLSAGDSPTFSGGGSAVSIMVRTDETSLRAGWAILAQEGQIIAPLEPFAPEGGELIGTLVDKFGFTWIFTVG